MTGPYRVVLAALVLLAACSSQDVEIGNHTGGPPPQSAPGAASTPLSRVHMADPAGAAQLLSGFHGLEQSAWRWTERKFSVSMKSPLDSARPAQLNFRFAIPPVVIERLKSVTLTASAGGVVIGSETYGKAGEHQFKKPLPTEAAGSGDIQIDFELEKAIPAGELEVRELGVIAISVSVE